MEDWAIRWGAAQVLGSTGDPRAVEALARAGREYRRPVSAWEERAPAGPKPARGVRLLVEALKDQRHSLQWGKPEYTDGQPPGKKQDIEIDRFFTGQAQWEQLTGLGEVGMELLVDALKGRDPQIRESAAWALGEIGDAQMVEPLVQALKDESTSVRKAAEESLERILDNISASQRPR